MSTEKKREYMKLWRVRNREALREYLREWLEKNKEANAPKAAIRNARWYAKVKKTKEETFVGPPKPKKEKRVSVPRVLLTPEECQRRKLERTKNWRTRHKDDVLAYKRYYAKARPDIITASNKRFYENNKEKRLADQREYRRANPEAARRSVQQWLDARPGIAAAYGARRRAAVIRATPRWVDKKAIEAYYISAEVLRMLTGFCYHVDHKVPLRGRNVCGLHTHDNLEILLKTDNLRKGNKFEDW